MHKIIILIASICLIGCAGAPKASPAQKSSAKGKEPAWVSAPRTVYEENKYVSAVGYGSDRETAEKNALASLVGIFGQTVKGETTVSSRYSEAVKSGKIAITENTDIDQAVKTSIDMDTVVGAEIKDTWDNGKGTLYAVAVMDKMKAAVLYSSLLESNEATIKDLISIPDTEKNTLDAYARYDLASAIGDTNVQFLNVLSVLSPGAAAAKHGTITTGDQMRLEVLKIAKNTPIAVEVEGDREDRIKAAFSTVFSSVGFKTGGVGSRYVLKVKVTLNEVVLAENKNKFARYIVDARLTDTLFETVLLPYNISGREGHTSVVEAENRAVRTAEAKIGDDFLRQFSLFLSQLNPK